MKSLLRILAISMAVLGLLALSASAAQALEWRIEAKVFAQNETFESRQSTNIEFVTEVGLTVSCAELSNTGFLQEGNPGKERNVAFTLGECTAVGFEEACTVEPIATVATEGTAIDGPEESKTKSYVKFKPEVGEEWGEVTFGGAECPLAGSLPLTGEACGEGEKKGPPGEAIEQPLKSPAVGCESTLALGEFPVTLKGTLLTFLTGPHTGQRWGVR